MQQRVLELEGVLEAETAYRKQMEKVPWFFLPSE